MPTPPETPNRNLQREMVLQQIANPVSRELIRSGIPSNREINYLNDLEGHQITGRFIFLTKAEGGPVYQSILAIAATAENENQLRNAFGLMVGIQRRAQYDRADKPAIELAQTQFLKTTVVPRNPSDGARVIQGDMIAIWNQTRDDKHKVDDAIGRISVNLQGSMIELRNEFSLNQSRRQTMQYWLEGYLLAILDPNTPFGLRQALLSNPQYFNLLSLKEYRSAGDRRFDRYASIWRSTDASWLYPEIFGQQNGGDVKDWEIAGLRRTIADMQRQLEARTGGGVEKERAQLQGLITRLQQAIAANEEKLRVYKEIGQHPLDALEIGYTIWKNGSVEERRQTVLQAYRAGARKYHYQIPQSDPNFNPLLQELANKEFSRLTKAYDYLNKNLEKNDF